MAVLRLKRLSSTSSWIERVALARPGQPQRAESYTHEEEALLRPDVGTQAQFRKKKPPKTYRGQAVTRSHRDDLQ